jgi:hypothetical protein
MIKLKRIVLIAALMAGTIQPAAAQWRETGGWQCGPFVRVTTSIDDIDGIDFFVRGAWFDNHYTLRRGELFYNGVPCAPFGFPFGPPPKSAAK